MGVSEIEAFLSHLAQEGNVSASTQNQAFKAILFLYRNVLKIELAAPIHALRAKRAQRLPIVLSKTEVSRLLSEMQGLHQLMARLLRGCCGERGRAQARTARVYDQWVWMISQRSPLRRYTSVQFQRYSSSLPP
jgi:hypothetical protein